MMADGFDRPLVKRTTFSSDTMPELPMPDYNLIFPLQTTKIFF